MAEDSPSLLDRGYGPDPSLLTSASIQREIEHLDRLLTFRIDAVEKAAVKANDDLTRIPTETDKQIARLKELTDEKFAAVQQQIIGRDRAVEAAFQAARDAVSEQNDSSDRAIAKAEAATTKELDSLKRLNETEIAALRDQIGALQQRIDRGEGVTGGTTAQRTEHRADRADRNQSLALAVSIVVAAISLLGLIAVVAAWSHP